MSIGGPEIIVLFLLALIVFGPRKLPEIGRSLGQAMRELRRMSSEVTSVFEEALDDRRRSSTYGHEWLHPEDENLHRPAEHSAGQASPEDEAHDDPYADVYAGEDLTSGDPADGEETGARSGAAGGFDRERAGEAAAERTD